MTRPTPIIGCAYGILPDRPSTLSEIQRTERNNCHRIIVSHAKMLQDLPEQAPLTPLTQEKK